MIFSDSSLNGSSSHILTDRVTRAAATLQKTERDDELVRRFNAGDESAFVEIMARYRGKILGVAIDMLHNHGDAEEIAQDTFIRAYRGLARFRGDASLTTWLHRIAANLARNRYWYFFRRRRHITLSLDCSFSDEGKTTLADLVAADAPSPASDAENNEFSIMIAEGMEQLEPPQRAILELRSATNRSYHEIAQELGLKVGTVKSRLSRARISLRKLMATGCPDFENNACTGDWFQHLALGRDLCGAHPAPGYLRSAARLRTTATSSPGAMGFAR
jgi:RNA polymerase sigma-70 factor (ECF subfamily)